MAGNNWTERDTEICKAGVASGKAINIATGKPMTFGELQGLHDEMGSVRGRQARELFVRERIRSEPFDNGPS